MKGSLIKKFFIFYSAFIIISFMFLIVGGNRMIYNRILENTIYELNRKANVLTDSIVKEGTIYKGTTYTSDREIRQFASYNDVNIWLLNAYGRIIYTSNDSSKHLIGTYLDDDFDKNKVYMNGDFNDSFHESTITITRPIIKGYKIIGYVLVHYPMANVIYDTNYMLKSCFLIYGITILSSLLLLLFFYFSINIPVKKLNQGVKKFSQGSLDYKIDLKRDDELGLMADALNYMSDKIYENEEYQRRLIGNVSHDFRSPLTSIKGYVEAILDGVIPPEMQEKYLNTVLRETNRLKDLTEELLSINAIDSKRMILDIQDFDINPVIKDTIASFEGRCLDRNIAFNLIFADSINIVRADMNRIKQVLYNLIDNAIKFSYDNSKIIIETSISKDKLIIAVKDYGRGIAQEDIGKIWDRFYKSDPSRGVDKNSSGLGLSIVKDIIQLHNENINVVSTKKVGTEFFFSLPLVKKE